jgi:hypothetical protein
MMPNDMPLRQKRGHLERRLSFLLQLNNPKHKNEIEQIRKVIKEIDIKCSGK